MLRIVLPFSVSLAAVDVVDVILVKIVLIVNRHVPAAVPITIPPMVRPGGSEDDSCSKR
jgi:hypothetical protein